MGEQGARQAGCGPSGRWMEERGVQRCLRGVVDMISGSFLSSPSLVTTCMTPSLLPLVRLSADSIYRCCCCCFAYDYMYSFLIPSSRLFRLHSILYLRFLYSIVREDIVCVIVYCCEECCNCPSTVLLRFFFRNTLHWFLIPCVQACWADIEVLRDHRLGTVLERWCIRDECGE